jgi:hypothetical protein
MSAQRVRDRQRAREEYLEATAGSLDQENSVLESQCLLAQSSQSTLLAELAELKAYVARYATRLVAFSEAETETESLHSAVSPAPSWSSDEDDFNQPAATPDSPISTASSAFDLSDADSAMGSELSFPAGTVYGNAQLLDSAAFGVDSCESAALAHPQQQDILSFVIALQLLLRTALGLTAAFHLMTAMQQTLTSRHFSMPSSPCLPTTCDAQHRRASGIGSPAFAGQWGWPPRLAVT